MQYRPIIIWLIVVLPAFGGARPCPAQTNSSLRPDQIALIVNSNDSDGRVIAEAYCLKRNVPTSQIIALPMPRQEIVSRAEYAQKIAPLLRERLNQDDLKDKIRCLITVRGVPLQIGGFAPTGPTQLWRDLIMTQLDERFEKVKRLTEELNALAGKSAPPVKPDQPETKFQLSRNPFTRVQEAQTLLNGAAQALVAARNAVNALKSDNPLYQPGRQKLQDLNLLWSGLQGRYVQLDQDIQSAADPDELAAMKKQHAEIRQELILLNDRLSKIDQATLDMTEQKDRYGIIEQALGVSVLCRVLLQDRERIDDELSAAAFDSELSLILRPDYPLRLWQPNELRAWPTDSSEPAKPADRPESDQTTLMVSRLDGPTLPIALGLIEKAIEAEKIVLRGTTYIDARGRHNPKAPFGSPEYTDESLRKTARYLREHTALKVVLDDQEALFGPEACPDTSLYCGWYSLRNYVDSFTFNPGAVGFHIASFEAETLRAGEPDSNIWCKRMLEKGITATLGAVAEPYLQAFPLPDQFFADLVGGQYCLVECFYRTSPFNSWQLILIGDPLYRPRFAKTAGFKPIIR